MARFNPESLFPNGWSYWDGRFEGTFVHDTSSSTWWIEIAVSESGEVVHRTRPRDSRFDAYRDASAWCETHRDAIGSLVARG